MTSPLRGHLLLAALGLFALLAVGPPMLFVHGTPGARSQTCVESVG